MLLSINSIYAGYGSGNILQGVSAEIKKSEIVGVIGRNGMGKTTLIKSIIGLLTLNSGTINFMKEDISLLDSYQRARKGIGYVPQGREVFPRLTVLENLEVGELVNSEKKEKKYDMIFEYFPILYERKKQLAGTLSGGQQQMLAISRAIVGNPYLLLLDEPSEGVQPNIVFEIGEKIKQMNTNENLTILLVDQNMKLIKNTSHRIYVMENGKFVKHIEKNLIDSTEDISKYISI